MKKQVEDLRKIIATIFVSINESQRKRGTGLMFKYKNEPFKLPGTDEEGWIFSIILQEPGYGERTMQSFPFSKANGVDRYQMEYNVLMSALIIFTENTFLQWNELGKMLNADKELQKIAKETLNSDD